MTCVPHQIIEPKFNEKYNHLTSQLPPSELRICAKSLMYSKRNPIQDLSIESNRIETLLTNRITSYNWRKEKVKQYHKETYQRKTIPNPNYKC
jgi:hypothetical protein